LFEESIKEIALFDPNPAFILYGGDAYSSESDDIESYK